MPDSRVLADHDVQKLRVLLGAEEDDAFRLGVTLLEACQPTPADCGALFTGELLQAVVDSRDPSRWEELVRAIRSESDVVGRFRTLLIRKALRGGLLKRRTLVTCGELTDILETSWGHLRPRWSPEVVAILDDFTGDLHVELGGGVGPWRHLVLPRLSPDEAALLAKHQGDLFIHGGRDTDFLSIEAASALALHRHSLELVGVWAISDATAAELANHAGPALRIGLTSLSPVAARALAARDRDLSLGWLDDPSDEAMAELLDGDARVTFSTSDGGTLSRFASLNAVFKNRRVTCTYLIQDLW